MNVPVPRASTCRLWLTISPSRNRRRPLTRTSRASRQMGWPNGTGRRYSTDRWPVTAITPCNLFSFAITSSSSVAMMPPWQYPGGPAKRGPKLVWQVYSRLLLIKAKFQGHAVGIVCTAAEAIILFGLVLACIFFNTLGHGFRFYPYFLRMSWMRPTKHTGFDLVFSSWFFVLSSLLRSLLRSVIDFRPSRSFHNFCGAAGVSKSKTVGGLVDGPRSARSDLADHVCQLLFLYCQNLVVPARSFCRRALDRSSNLP